MSFEELFRQACFNWGCVWSWLENALEDNPYLLLAGVVVLLLMWLFLRPKFGEK